jgi:hypothetical protein
LAIHVARYHFLLRLPKRRRRRLDRGEKVANNRIAAALKDA